MSKVWVLDTETKGTGANMVPLERVLRKGSSAVPGFMLPELKPPAPAPAEPRAPRQFKVIDVLTRQVLAEGTEARATIHVLEGVRSIVDVTIWVWEPDGERWRMLTLEEARSLWEYRGRLGEANTAAVAS
ncbi:MAG: hypothetical protein JOZ95_16990 [Solirubrobacterales bacterium]|nr:hypothetical protein [Solirubrobacterales bacterium]